MVHQHPRDVLDVHQAVQVDAQDRAVLDVLRLAAPDVLEVVRDHAVAVVALVVPARAVVAVVLAVPQLAREAVKEVVQHHAQGNVEVLLVAVFVQMSVTAASAMVAVRDRVKTPAKGHVSIHVILHVNTVQNNL